MAITGVWLMLVGVFGFGKRYLDRTSASQRYLAEASYPLCILHQTVIVVIGFYAVQVAKWILLFIGSILGTFALYEIARRAAPFRLILGMKLKRRRTAPTRAERSTA